MTVSIKIERDQVAYGKRLAARLRSVMGSRSATEWAKELGVSQPTLSRYLRGTTPQADFLALVCERESVNPVWLLLGLERSGDEHPVDCALRNLSILASLSPGDADHVLGKLSREFSPSMLADPEFWGRRK
jgi:transcriptional regulator with XRE-family HTH domain